MSLPKIFIEEKKLNDLSPYYSNETTFSWEYTYLENRVYLCLSNFKDDFSLYIVVHKILKNTDIGARANTKIIRKKLGNLFDVKTNKIKEYLRDFNLSSSRVGTQFRQTWSPIHNNSPELKYAEVLQNLRTILKLKQL